MLLHYCQLVILDVLREQLFVKETQLLPRNLFFLSFSWLEGTWAPAEPLSGQFCGQGRGTGMEGLCLVTHHPIAPGLILV